MARRLEITDAQWKAFEPILSSDRKKMGRPRNDDRKTFNGIYWVLRTGAPWRDMPEMYGKWQTVYKRFAQWQESGQLEAVFNELRKDCDTQDICIDGTYIKAHRDSAGAKRGISILPKTSILVSAVVDALQKSTQP